jgi:hypothetical protein
MLPNTGIDDVKKQRNAEYAKHINDPVLSSLKMEGIRFIILFFTIYLVSDIQRKKWQYCTVPWPFTVHTPKNSTSNCSNGGLKP